MSAIMKGIVDEEVGGNYLYHATSAGGLKSILQSGVVQAATGPQLATRAQTKMPTVSVTRDWGYASGSNATQQMGGIGRDAILVFDRSRVENNFKTLGTSQSSEVRGLAYNPNFGGKEQNQSLQARTIAKKKYDYAQQSDPETKASYNTPKAGGEFEEAVVVPKGGLPIKGTLVGFWVNPESSLTKDPEIMNNPFRLDKTGPNKFVKAAQSQPVNEEELDENLRKWFKEKWVRFGPDGKIRGACARGDDSEGKPKCLPQKKAQNLGKKGRKYAASKKRREDPNPERTGKAKNVATKKKTNEGVPFDECPKCRGPIVHESMMTEKQDACYHKVKSRYKVWPSAYASGALVQCRKKGASNWGTGGKKNESNIMKGIVDEAKAKPYVKPFIENGKQVGWKSSDGYHVKYWQMFAKDSAIKHAKLNPDEVQEDYTGEFAAEQTPAINPYGGLKDNKFRGAISEEPTNNPTGASGEGGTRRYRPKPAGTFNEDLSQADVDSIARFADKLYKKLGIDITFTKHFMDRVNDERNGKPISGAELVRLFKKEYERWGKDVAQMGPDMEGTFKDLTTDINLPFVLRWDRDEEELDLVAKTVMRKKNFKTDNQEFPVDEDTSYAGGMGQGGNAGESYRKFKPKSAGTFNEEQLDEKCWDTHKQVGMKNKGGRQVPNCVPKESAILKGINRLI